MLRSMAAAVLLTVMAGFLAPSAAAGDDTLYMAVLNSRKHKLNASDNPMVGTFVSHDGGMSWAHLCWREYIRTFYVVAGTDGTIWAACGNGILRSADNGRSWKITTGWNVTEVLKVTVDPSSPSTVYGATAYGVVKTTNRGDTWTVCNNGLRRPFASDVVVDRTDGRRLLAATEVGIYASTSGAKAWRLTGLSGKGIRTVVQDPGDPRIFWAGTEEDGVFRSSDRGRSWTHLSAGLEHGTVYAIAINPANPRTVYAGTHGGGVYKSVDGGAHWRQTSAGLSNTDIHTIVVLSSDPATVFAGTLNGGLFVSHDGGEHWQFNSQEEAQVWGLSVQPR